MSNEELLPTTVPTRRPTRPLNPDYAKPVPPAAAKTTAQRPVGPPNPRPPTRGPPTQGPPHSGTPAYEIRSIAAQPQQVVFSLPHFDGTCNHCCIHRLHPPGSHDMTMQTPTTEPVVSGVCTATAATQTSNHGTSETEPVVNDIPRHPVPYNTPPSRRRSPSMTSSRATS
ncbi:hypothetical protein GE061_001416 [Apolygus lucorum]|uniref:Uncharacterized protein n=1 Tax=Apolygus lucorum TaxID=248454 RepID=A0A8S9Y7A6_APOLU|nr:hypothetical protein GE061_001416 [Apolygus lucorum]